MYSGKTDIEKLLDDHARLTWAFAMAHLAPEQQVLHLIQSDLRHHSLLYSLCKAGIETDHFNLNLHLPVFHLLGFTSEQQESKTLYDFYYKQKDNCMKNRTADFTAHIPEMAQTILEALKNYRKEHN